MGPPEAVKTLVEKRAEVNYQDGGMEGPDIGFDIAITS